MLTTVNERSSTARANRETSPGRGHSTSLMFQLPSWSWGEPHLTSRLSIFRVQLWDRIDLSVVRIHHRSLWMASGFLHDRYHRNNLVSLLVLLCLRHTSCSSKDLSTGTTLHTWKHRQSSFGNERGNACTMEVDSYVMASLGDRYYDLWKNMGPLCFYYSWSDVYKNRPWI